MGVSGQYLTAGCRPPDEPAPYEAEPGSRVYPKAGCPVTIPLSFLETRFLQESGILNRKSLMSNNLIQRHISIRWYEACPWTLGLSTVMLLLNLGLLFWTPNAENVLNWLQYDRSAIVEGQLWRLVTGNLVHWSAEHFLLDVAVFLFIGCLYERSLGNSYPWILFLTGMAVGASALIFLPQMALYRGLSGVDSGLFAAVLCLECGQAQRDRRNWLFLLPAVGIFVLKLGYESATGRMFFGTESLGDLGQPVPLAHAAGAFAAVLFFGLQHLRSGRFFERRWHPTKIA